MFAHAHTLARGLLLDRRVAFFREELGLSPGLRARVTSVRDETRDVRTLWLTPSRALAPHRAGQHVTLGALIDGVRTRRCYSISSAAPGGLRPTRAPFSVTVKRQGLFSSFLHTCRPGDVLDLGAPRGDFVLPLRVLRAGAPPPLLFLSGGSGVTPVMAMLRTLLTDRSLDGASPLDVVFIHCARTEAELIFEKELRMVAAHRASSEGASLRVVLRTDAAFDGPLDEASLDDLCPDFERRETLLCGPRAMMDAVAGIYRARGALGRLRRERYGSQTAGRADAPTAEPRAGLEVRLARGRRSLRTTGAPSLLEELERAGEKPAFGCRMGVCHSCRCTKTRGVVQNRLTGEVSSDEEEVFLPCVSLALSDLEVSL